MGAARSRFLATYVCSGRGGRRPLFQGGAVVSRGGSPPHPPSTIHSGAVVSRGGSPPHPPSTIHSGILGAALPGGGLCRVGCGVPPQAPGPVAGCARAPSPPPSPARGEGAVFSRGGSPPHPPSTIHSGILGAALPHGGLCRVGCGGTPQALAPWRAAPAPPHPHPLPQGARGPSSQGGAPPHTPPRRSTRGFLGLRCRTGGCAGWAAGVPRRRLPRGGLRPRPLTPTLSRKGRGGSLLKGGLPPTPPLDDPLGDSWGCVAARGVVPGGLRGYPAGACPVAGGVGAQPPHKENPRAGGRATSRAACSSGMGRGGAAPAGEGAPLTPTLSQRGEGAGGCRSGGRRTPSPPPSPARGEGAGGASRAAGGLPIRWGRGGAAPT